jgi:hypothetical protein
MQDAISIALVADSEASPLGRPPTGSVALSSTLAAAAVFVGVLLVGYWYQRRVQAMPKATKAEAAALASDLEELTERLANQLDVKAERVEGLIAAADERIRLLERLQMELPQATGVDPRLVEPRHRVRHETGLVGAGEASVEASHREVYELSDAGLSPVEIARRLDRHTGQVELILNLRRGTVAL